MAGGPGDVVGREAELATIDAALRRPGPTAIVLEGQAGIGKTTLWRAARERAEAGGRRVLATGAVEVEASIAFAHLSDLLARPLAELGGRLPAEEREALQLALRGGAGTQQPLAVGRAVARLLAELAREEPLVLALDDVQWLDPASHAALAFALRRLGDEPVSGILARRTGGREVAPLEEAFADRTVVPLRGLSEGAIGRIVATRLGASFRRPTVHRLHEASGGNPFYAIELGRVVLAEGERDDGSIPLPERLRDVLHGRLARLPRDTREALAVLASLAAPSDALLARAGLGGELDPAVEAEIVIRDGRELRFAHPLFRSVVLAQLGELRSRALHRRLADVTTGEERARHLALALVEPDEPAAAEIEAAARAARDRGASAAAAELAGAALRLTPAGEPPRARRATLAGEARWAAGDFEGGRALMVDVLADLPPSRERLELALAMLAAPRDVPGDLALADDALAGAAAHPDLESGLRHVRAILLWASGDVDAAYEEVDRAIARARAAGDETREITAQGFREALDVASRRSTRIDALERAAALEAERGVFTEMGSALMLGQCLFAVDRVQDAARWYERVAREVVRRGDPLAVNVLELRAGIAFRLGDGESALRLFTESIDLARGVGVENFEAGAHSRRGTVHAVRGDREDAEADFAHAERLLRRSGDVSSRLHILRGRLLLALTVGDAELAVAAARESAELAAGAAVGFTVDAEAAEALVAAGRLEDAEQLVRRVESEDLSTPRQVLEAALARAVLEAARARLDAAAEAAERGLAEAPQACVAFEEARLRLVAGSVARRRRDRGRAREHLLEARRLFEGLGAVPWLARVEDELARIPGRAPRAQGTLTPAEERVAALASLGRPNKAIAAELAVSQKTVEGHLGRIYEKLGVSGRAELAARLAKDRGNPP